MSVKWVDFLFTFLLLSILNRALSIKKGYYTIIVPLTVPKGSVFHASFTLNDFHKSCWFNVSLEDDLTNREINIVEGIEVQPGTTKLVALHAPSSTIDFGQFKFTGYRGIIREEFAGIFFEPEEHWAFIQTNKEKYMPGELVKFRVIFIDQLKRPAKFKELATVQIYDYQQNLIWNKIDVELVQGVFRSELQLSDYPVLGVWTIKAGIGKRNLAEKFFEVDRYELPNFHVQIVTRNIILIDEDQITLEIHANYFYGKPVRGKLSITIRNTGGPSNRTTPPTLTRETQINGRTTIVLDFKKDLHVEEVNEDQKLLADPYEFHIEVIVIDGSSQEQFYAETDIEVHYEPYRILIEASDIFSLDPILNIKVKVIIEDWESNSIQDPITPIEIIVECTPDIYEYSSNEFDMFRLEYKPQVGKDFAVINVTNKNYEKCYLSAEYQRIKSHKRFMYGKVFGFKLDILTESPQEGKELEIKITSAESIEEFSYEIQSRGDIIQSGHVNVPGNQTTYILRLDVVLSMVPKITIYVHYIQNMNFSGVFEDIHIQRAFRNSIEIETEKETTPGAPVNINVTTDEGSYVGLMGLDRRVLENIDKNDILNGDYVNSKLKSATGLRYPNAKPFAGGLVGDITVLSNIFPRTFNNFVKGAHPSLRLRTRKLFPESWLYIDFERTPAGGLQILETAPDTVTTWAITGFSIHPDNGLTFTPKTTNLKVFQEFFVEMDFPNLVREGEIIEVPIYISNYMNQDALTNVTIESNSEDLVLLMEDPKTVPKPNKTISKLISAEKRETLLVFFKPLKHGNYNVIVEVISSLASDAVKKTLNVQPQGIPYAISKTYLIHLTEESIQENEVTIDVPEHAVSGSERLEVSVVGDIFRPLMTKLQKHARVPYGNNEDNMRLIVSNSIVLKYLKALSYANPSLESKIRLNLQLGYQNQLSFKYLDGSFGLVERTIARTGDIWQTILALWGLNLAKEFVHVDPKVINRGLNYLRSKQQNDGCYKSESGIEEDAKFTAFGLMVFLMDEQHSRSTTYEYSKVLIKGLECLFDISDDLEYSPIYVMVGYVLLLGQHDEAEDFLRHLTFNSSFRSKRMQWTKSDTLQSHLETTAESLINLFEYQEIPEQSLLHIVRGLIVPKKGQSSVNHMVALQAMVGFVEKLSLSRKNLNIAFKDDRNKSGVFQLNVENSQVSQTFEVSQSARKINFISKGHGFAVVNVKYKYNLVLEKQSSSIYNFNISNQRTSNNFGILKICLNVSKTILEKMKVQPVKMKIITSNTDVVEVTVMEVNLQSGYIFLEQDFQLVKKLSEEIKSIQVSKSRDKVMIYFDNTSTVKACIELEVSKTYKVFNSKPGWVVVYDAHDEDKKTTKSFRINKF